MRQLALIAAKAAVSVGLLCLALRNTDFGAIGARLERLDWAWSIAALIIVGVQIAVASLRWQHIATHCGAAWPLSRAFRLNLIAAFFNQVLPSTVGGDSIRIFLLARDGNGWAKATHSVLLDRFIGVLALALMVLICLPWSFRLIESPTGRIVLLLIGCGSVAGGAAFVALGSRNWAWMQNLWLTRQLAQLAEAALGLFKPASRGGLLMSLSLIVHVLTAAVAWSVARALAVPFDFLHALLLLPPVVLIATIPISIAGWGVRESALMLAFSYAGLSQTDGLLVSILFGAAYFAVGILGGVVWLAGGRRTPLSAMRQPDQRSA